MKQLANLLIIKKHMHLIISYSARLLLEHQKIKK